MPVVHCKRDLYDVYIGRPSKWGNPFSHLDKDDLIHVGSREEAVQRYRAYLWKMIKKNEVSVKELAELDGKTLGCWCAPKACHGDVLSTAAKWASKQQEN